MRIELDIGDKSVVIDTSFNGIESDATWGEVMDDLIMPALRAHGYVIDEDWSSDLVDNHREFLRERGKR